MKGVPRDIDEMMWVIADRPTEDALNDFEARFPEFRGELGRRLAMVRNLRAGNPLAPIPSAPKFRAPAPATRPIWPYAAAAIALATVGFAATRSVFTAPPAKPKVVVATQLGDTALPPGAQSPDAVRPLPVDNGTKPNVQVPNPERPQKPVQTYKSLKVSLKGAPLAVALEAIAAQAGIQVEVAPGLENILVDVQYNDMTAPQMFENLGSEHGFTALEQEFGKFLIVPARPN